MNIKEPSWKEVSDVVKKTRSASSPGPNGIPYKINMRRYVLKVLEETVTWARMAFNPKKSRALVISVGLSYGLQQAHLQKHGRNYKKG
ncbi:Hypothetical predicted protein [Mytilus galloprovincialis]|uniref:Uncharacterized protein n=1 Tax=Mytilus galloprovincialis TaxID=29158 RepID=A0A8B6HQA6_MYTGA|nr:Hypothetical predicted protein [Mytilus galloprovincialis]